MKKLVLFSLLSTMILGLLGLNHPVELREMLKEGDRVMNELIESGELSKIENSKNSRTYSVGDTESFWKWNFTAMPPSNQLLASTCRAVGEHFYMFVADEEWNDTMNQADIDTIFPYLDTNTMSDLGIGAVQMDIDVFGPIPDVHDNDPKLIIFYSELQSYNGSAFDGYFNIYNQMTEAQAQAADQESNECEMIYMTCNPLDPAEPIRISVLSHELQHLIHWGMDANEATWVDEGCAEYAMHMFGMPDPITGFPTNSNNDLTSWDQTWSDYVQTYLFFAFIAENYGGSDIISAIVAETQNENAGIEAALNDNGYDVSFADVFTEWTNANFLKDYETLDLPSFTPAIIHTQYPATRTSTVEGWAAKYIRLTNGANDIEIHFESEGTFNVNVLKYNIDGNHEIQTFITEAGSGSVLVPAFEGDFSYIGLNVSNITSEETEFSYNVRVAADPAEKDFWTYNFNGGGSTLVSATKRAIGPNCNIYVADLAWNNTVDAEGVNFVRRAFEDSTASDYNKGIYELDTAMFGTPSDIDGNLKVNILIYNIDDSGINGYFSPSDIMGGSYSNDMELLYIDDSPHDAGMNSSYCYSTLAHEFQHLIHHTYDENETTWVNEGLSGFAQWVNGWISPYWMMPFVQNPDNSLTSWNAGADYPQSYLFMQYLYEHYSIGENDIILNLVAEEANSADGVTNALLTTGWDMNITAKTVYTDWLIANYINDQEFMDGKYSYSDNPVGTGQFAMANSGTHSAYPVGTVSETVNHWGVDYVKFSNIDLSLDVTFSGDINNSDYHVEFILFDGASPVNIVKMVIDENMMGTIAIPNNDNSYDSAVMVVSDTGAYSSTTSYSYSAQQVVPNINETTPAADVLLNCYPNPFNPETTIKYNVPSSYSNLTLDIFNSKGQKVESIKLPSNRGSYKWNGSECSTGTYFYRISSNNDSLVIKKMVMLK